MDERSLGIGSLSRFFGSYGPDLLVLGLVAGATLGAISVSGRLADWVPPSFAGVGLVALALTRFHDWLRDHLYLAARQAGTWLLGKLPIKQVALYVGAALLGVVVLGLPGLGVITTTGYARVGSIVPLAMAAIGLTGHLVWYRKLSSRWRASNP